MVYRANFAPPTQWQRRFHSIPKKIGNFSDRCAHLGKGSIPAMGKNFLFNFISSKLLFSRRGRTRKFNIKYFSTPPQRFEPHYEKFFFIFFYFFETFVFSLGRTRTFNIKYFSTPHKGSNPTMRSFFFIFFIYFDILGFQPTEPSTFFSENTKNNQSNR